MQLSAWFAFFVMMTAIAYTPGPMTLFSMSSGVKHGFYRTLPGIFGGSAADEHHFPVQVLQDMIMDIAVKIVRPDVFDRSH